MANRIALVLVALTVAAPVAHGDTTLQITAEPPGTVVELAPPAKRGTCTTPCALPTPPGRVALRLSGPVVEASTVEVDVPPSGAAIRVRAPRQVPYNVGALLTAIGVPVALAGIGVMAVPATEPPMASGDWPFYAGGAATLGVGLVLTTAGAVLLARERPRLVDGAR